MSTQVGRQTVNNVEIVELDIDPRVAPGFAANTPSLAFVQQTIGGNVVGTAYIKRGPLDTDWGLVDDTSDWNLNGNILTGLDGLNPTEFFGSNNDFDVVFKRNASELMRIASQGVLIGLSASIGGRLQVGASALGDILTAQTTESGDAFANVIRLTRQYKIQTTDDTPASLFDLEVPEGSRVQVSSVIGANQHGGIAGAIGDGADYQRVVSAKRLAGGAAVINGLTSPFTEEDVRSFRSRYVENANNVQMEVRGAVDRNVAWSAHVQYMIFMD